MARPQSIGKTIVLCLVLGAGGVPAPAQEGVTPEPEAPTTIFSATLGSADVDLTLLGSWTMDVSFGGGILLAPGLPLQGIDSFPSLDKTFVFNQIPDVTASLLLMNRFFLDVSILGSFDNNSIQLGYRGAAGEVLQSAILGNQGITMAPSALMQVPTQPKGSLGVMARLASGAATNDLLLRWDAVARKHKTFVGKNELVEQEVSLDAYIRETYFYLPDFALDADTLKVFLEDPAGTYSGADGSQYREAVYDDVILDSPQGLVTLRAPPEGRVLVFYQKLGSPVGATSGAALPDDQDTSIRDPASAEPFSWGLTTYLDLDMMHRRIPLTGIGDCLLLWEPGDNSPFEMDNIYAFDSTPPDDETKISYRFVAKTPSASKPEGMHYRSIPGEKRFAVQKVLDLRATFENFYPFSDPDGLLYGPQRDSLSGMLDYSLFVQFLTPVDDLTLDTNIVPGSVQVEVNGIAETRYEVDPASGKLTLSAPILPTDRIEVSYGRTEAGTTGGDILFAWRDQISLGPLATLSLSAGIRWNADPWTYSQEPYAKSGTAIATAGISGGNDTFSYSAEAGVAYTNPDTTGILRLFGMEGNVTPLDLSEENAYPSGTPTGRSQLDRGYLYYRDYRLYGALGAVLLQPIEWELPAAQRLEYKDGSRMGPYNVLGDSESLSAQDLVLDYSLNAGQWVGTQLPITAGADADLSTARALTIRLKGLGLTGTVTISLELGSLAEDLDDQGLDEEASSAQAGFTFSDQSNGLTLKVGAGPKLTGNARLDTEDRNGNGILDGEDPTRVLYLPVQTPGTGWSTVTIALSDTDRQKLLQARGVRIVIDSGSGSATGKILIDSLVIESAPFWPVTSSAADRARVSVREITERLSGNDPGPSLRMDSLFPVTYKRFHPAAEPNQVLEVAWTGATDGDFSVRGFLAQGTGGIRYDTFVSYVRTLSPAETYTFSLLDAAERGAVWRVSFSDSRWHEVKVSRVDSKVYVDGEPVEPPPDRYDASYGSLTTLRIDIPPVSAAGSLFVDEVYGADPAGSVGAALVASFSAKLPGPIISAGAVPIVSNVSISQDFSLVSAGFAPLYGIPTATDDLTSRTLVNADLLFIRTSANLLLRDSTGTFSAAGGHRVVVPSVPSPVTVTDVFSLTWAGGFSRENELRISPGSFLSLTLDASADADPGDDPLSGLLTQAWQAGLTLSALAPLSLSSTLSVTQALSGYSLQQRWYGARWVQEAALIAPWPGGADERRTGKLTVGAALPAAPLGFNLDAEAGADASRYAGGGFAQENDASLSLALTAKLGPTGDASLSLAYKRALALTTSPSTGARFTTEAEEWGRVLALQGYLLSFIPFVEVFTDNVAAIRPEWSSASAGTYTPSATFTLQRSYGARIIDFFLPSSVEVSIGQDLKKTDYLWQTMAYVRPKTTTRAVNLFGELGVFPVLAGVRTDEYSLSVSASLDGPPETAPVLTSLTLEAYATLTGKRENELTVTESLRWDQTKTILVSNDVQLLYDWTVRPAGGVPLPLIPRDATSSGYFTHRESADVTIGFQESGSSHPCTIVLGHSSSLAFEGHGSVMGRLNLGIDTETVGPAGIAWRFAVRAAFEGKLTF